MLLLLLLFALSGAPEPPREAPQPPRLMLWAWESPTDLRFLRPEQAGVAFEAPTQLIDGEKVGFIPRKQPLRVNPGVYLMAVVRIDSFDDTSHSPRQLRELARALADIVKTTGVKALQIDFDARKSEHDFYRTLIADVRKAIGTEIFLSVTALPSWCAEGNWAARMGADEVVPMRFRWRSAEACGTSVGIRAEETSPPLKGYRRVYVFPGGYRWHWTPEYVARLQELIKP